VSPKTEAGAAEDARDVAAVLGGNADAFGAIVRRHQDALYRLAFGMVHDSDIAADLVQDALVRGYRNLARCANPWRLGAWLMQIVRNRALDHLKAARRRDVPLDAVAEPAAPGDGVYALALRRDLGAALAALAPTLREAFLLRHVEGLEYEEMAEILDAGTGAIKMRVSRARAELRQWLEQHGHGGASA
jgi:RNA polymerase sigma-70 factor, ECF subfamily